MDVEKGSNVRIGLMGLGVVGSGVARVLLDKGESLARETGISLSLKKVLVRDPSKPRSIAVPSHMLTADPQDILADPEIDVVVEVIGGENPALEYIAEALSRGKCVATANKEVVAKHGLELLDTAARHGVGLMYEASVGGGIPLLLPLGRSLPANEISTVYGIINGTTNYILTKMSAEGGSFAEALAQAQALGYAEADATNDIEGIDAAYKLAILATAAFHSRVSPEDIYCQGITALAEQDFRYARELDYEIKLLAIAKQSSGIIEARVHPVLIPSDFLLAKVNGVHNAVQVEGDLVGQVLFYGEGAGSLPTSSAVLADVIALAEDIVTKRAIGPAVSPTNPATGLGPGRQLPAKSIRPISELETRYYLRMNIADQPGVLAQIAKILGDLSISISSVIQKEADAATQTAEIVIMTHPAREHHVQQALGRIAELDIVKEVCNFIRVEG